MRHPLAAIAIVCGLALGGLNARPLAAADQTGGYLFRATALKSALAANGIKLCSVVVCSGLKGANGERSWEANFVHRGITYNIYVALERTPQAAATLFDALGGLSEYNGHAEGRLGNLFVVVGRFYPRPGHHPFLPFPSNVVKALARLAGAGATSQLVIPDRLCVALAKHPFDETLQVFAPTCSGLPRSADTEYRFDDSLQRFSGDDVNVTYRVYPSVANAAIAWTRDRTLSGLAEPAAGYLAMRSIGGIPGLTLPSVIWASSKQRLPSYLYPGMTAASFRAGRVNVTMQLSSPRKPSDVATIERLARGVAAHVLAIERG